MVAEINKHEDTVEEEEVVKAKEGTGKSERGGGKEEGEEEERFSWTKREEQYIKALHSRLELEAFMKVIFIYTNCTCGNLSVKY